MYGEKCKFCGNDLSFRRVGEFCNRCIMYDETLDKEVEKQDGI